MRVINLFAGPGSGKSTTAAGLFFLMKINGYNVELVTEAAKDATWEEHHFLLGDQYAMCGEQNRRLSRLVGKVDYVITDSPLLLGLAYLPEKYVPSFPIYVEELFKSYNNFLNVWINRVKPYSGTGRNQTAEEAIKKDAQINTILGLCQLPVITIAGDGNAPIKIFNILKQEEKEEKEHE